MYDIVIVGGGPSGALLARALDPRLSVALVERDPGRAKCCGGLVAPDAQKVLAALDLGIPKRILVDPQLFYVRSLDLDAGLERSYQRHYLNVDRLGLDRWLRAFLEGRPRFDFLADALYVGHRRAGGGLVARIETSGGLRELECRVLVGADGAASRVREALFGDSRRRSRYLAIQGTFPSPGRIHHYGVFFARALGDYYSWLIPKDDRVLAGGAFRADGAARGKFELLLRRLEEAGYGLGRPESIDAAFLARPRPGELRLGDASTALVGEAAGFVSPSSGEGLSYAFRSALALAGALNASLDDWPRLYAARARRLALGLLLKWAKAGPMYEPRLRRAIFATGIGALGRGI